MAKLLYVCNECEARHENKAEHCKTCGSDSIRIVLESELLHILAAQKLKEERLCSNCQIPMKEGFYFESDGTQYCSEECQIKVISWEEYMKIYDDGNGDAYWTRWEDTQEWEVILMRVLSIPASGSYNLIKKYEIHAFPHPRSYDTSGLVTYRKKGGFMDRLYRIQKMKIGKK